MDILRINLDYDLPVLHLCFIPNFDGECLCSTQMPEYGQPNLDFRIRDVIESGLGNSLFFRLDRC